MHSRVMLILEHVQSVCITQPALTVANVNQAFMAMQHVENRMIVSRVLVHYRYRATIFLRHAVPSRQQSLVISVWNVPKVIPVNGVKSVPTATMAIPSCPAASVRHVIVDRTLTQRLKAIVTI